MNILGIETSCDETAASVVADEIGTNKLWRIRSNIVSSQVKLHAEWGGVVPELASRQHVRDICPVVKRALSEADLDWHDLSAIAVTQGPGLIGSLLVGVAFSKGLAASLGIPLIPVNHLAGHIESLFLHNGSLPLPSVVLVVSGGHTSLYLVPEPGIYRLIGRTRDDAAGEAYDKVAKLLGLSYPGGPAIDQRARDGCDDAILFPVARMTHRDRNKGPSVLSVPGFEKDGCEGRRDFSFSGLKTSVRRYVESCKYHDGENQALQDSEISDICASFQKAVVESLLNRTFEAAKLFGAQSVGISGGVAANSRLRADALSRGSETGLSVYLPTLDLSTDNAAMIAAAGFRRLREGVSAPLDLNAEATLII